MADNKTIERVTKSPVGYQHLLRSYDYVINTGAATTYETPAIIKFPYACYIDGISILATAQTDGDLVNIDLVNENDAVWRNLARRWRLKAADFEQGFDTMFLDKILAGEGLSIEYFNYADQDKTCYIDLGILVPLTFLTLDTESTQLWDDDKGATRAGGSALTATIARDGTYYTEGIYSLKHTITSVNLANDEWARVIHTPALDFYASDLTTFYVSYRCDTADMQDLCVILEDGSGNYSYWTFTPPAANTWTTLTCTAASPTGNGGTAADLTDISKVIVATQQKASAVNFIVYVDGVYGI